MANKFQFSNMKETLGLILLLVSLVTGIYGILEYQEQGRLHRVQYFLDMRHRFKDNAKFQEISDKIYTNSDQVSELSHRDRADYAGFFEEVALLVEGGYVSQEVAFYMFGFYAINCWDYEGFWVDLEQNSKNWEPLGDFVRKMKLLGNEIQYPEDFRL